MCHAVRSGGTKVRQPCRRRTQGSRLAVIAATTQLEPPRLGGCGTGLACCGRERWRTCDGKAGTDVRRSAAIALTAHATALAFALHSLCPSLPVAITPNKPGVEHTARALDLGAQ